MAEGKVIGVMSFKGGVGKTTCTANLATCLSQLNKKVLAIDSNFSSPNLALNFGMIDPENTLAEVLNEDAEPEDAIHVHYSGVHILPSPQSYTKMNLSRFKKNIDYLRELYDFILIDCSPTINDELLIPLSACDELVIVTTPDYSTLLSTLLATQMMKDKGIPMIGLILNRKKNIAYELNEEEIEEAIGIDVIAALPEDTKVLEASYKLMPVAMYSPRRHISKEFKRLAARLSGKKYKEEGFFAMIGRVLFR